MKVLREWFRGRVTDPTEANLERRVVTLLITSVLLAIVDEEIVESIMARIQNGLVVLEPHSFKSGDRVLIHDGPFDGFQGIFEKELTGTERVVLLLQAVSY